MDNATSPSPNASPAQTTDYLVTVTGADGCSDTSSVLVTVTPFPVAAFTSAPACLGQPNAFTNNTIPAIGTTYTWTFGDGGTSTDDNPNHQYTQNGDTFQVTLVATLNGCPYTANGQAVVYPSGIANFGATPTIAYIDSSIQFIDSSINAISWNWNFGDSSYSSNPDPAHYYTYPGAYTVSLTITNQYGCNDSIVKETYIQIFQDPKVFIPNAFTPNGDGNNDKFLVYTNGVTFFELDVFDRWGEKVYGGNNQFDGWDGTYKGKFLPPAVYTYMLKLVYEDGKGRQFKGQVTLMR